MSRWCIYWGPYVAAQKGNKVRWRRRLDDGWWVKTWGSKAAALRYRNRNTARPEAKVMTVEDMQVERLLDEL